VTPQRGTRDDRKRNRKTYTAEEGADGDPFLTAD
jgi:hypothetical protein